MENEQCHVEFINENSEHLTTLKRSQNLLRSLIMRSQNDLESSKRKFYAYVLCNPLKEFKKETSVGFLEFEPFYVGKGQGDRMTCHEVCAINNPQPIGHITHYKLNTIRKIHKCGKKVVYHKVDNLTEDEAFELEIKLIKEFGRKDRGTGFLTNLTDGGDGVSGRFTSELTRYKLRSSHIGHRASLETKYRMSIARKGRPRSEETIAKIKLTKSVNGVSVDTRQKLSDALKGNQNAKGVVRSEETRRKMSESRKLMLAQKRLARGIN